MLTIVLNNKKVRYWKRNEYTTYEVFHGMLIVKNGEQWVAIYPLESLVAFECRHPEEDVL